MTSCQILFVAALSSGSSCIPRLRGLQELGLEVRPVDTSSLYGSYRRVVNSLTRRSFFTPRALALNRVLLDACCQFRPDFVWLDKAVWTYPFVLSQLRKHVRFLVHYNTDDIFAKGVEFWLHKLGIRQYDLHVTTNRWNVLEIPVRYGVRALHAGMGYDRNILDTVTPGPNAAVFFGGHWEPHTEQYITALAAAGVPVRVCGHDWRKANDPLLRAIQPATYAEYLAETASARIALCRSVASQSQRIYYPLI